MDIFDYMEQHSLRRNWEIRDMDGRVVGRLWDANSKEADEGLDALVRERGRARPELVYKGKCFLNTEVPHTNIPFKTISLYCTEDHIYLRLVPVEVCHEHA